MKSLTSAQAVILAGGKGTRLGPLTTNLPKPLVAVAGKPFLHWQIEYLKRQGIRRVLLLISHLGEMIVEYFAKNPSPGLEISFSREPQPMGTGGALQLAKKQLEERFWLINGDSFLPLDMAKMEAAAAAKKTWRVCIAALNNLSLVPVPGNLKVHKNLITEYRKAGGVENGFTWVDAGVYLMNRDILSQRTFDSFDLENYWPGLVQRKELGIFPVEQRFFDIGTPERLKTFEEHVHDYI